MGLKKFLIWLIKSLIILLIVTFVFSTITLNFPNLIKGVLGDIFTYASPEVQKKVVNELAEVCSSLDKGQGLVTIAHVCTNRSLLQSMREDCDNYRELKKRNAKIENEAKVLKTCQEIESGQLETACSKFEEKGPLPDLSKIVILCKDYEAGKINDKEFFLNLISGVFPSQFKMPKIGILEKYNKVLIYLNNKLLYFVILAILIILLYLLIKNVSLFLITLSKIAFSIGILIMLPYFIIFAYNYFVGIDTTPVLSIMFGSVSGFGTKTILSVVLLLFLRAYTPFIITLGILFLSIGVAGKVYVVILKRKGKKATIKETKVKKKK